MPFLKKVAFIQQLKEEAVSVPPPGLLYERRGGRSTDGAAPTPLEISAPDRLLYVYMSEDIVLQKLCARRSAGQVRRGSRQAAAPHRPGWGD
ncbi:MAG TPA: hypothetical protein DEQ98_08105 [Acidobacteria bacterium]|nr:hypothetical protein [Acidobacteriota bacterium]